MADHAEKQALRTAGVNVFRRVSSINKKKKPLHKTITTKAQLQKLEDELERQRSGRN